MPCPAKARRAFRGDPGRGEGAARCHSCRTAPLACPDTRGHGQQRADARHAAQTRPDAKKKTLHAAEQERPDVAAARAAWRQNQAGLRPGRLIFLDETSVKTNMVRTHGWARIGERLAASVPHGHRKTSSFIGCLSEDGMIAPYVLDGAVNAELFVAYVEQVLVPTLQLDDIVMMDNLPVHKVPAVRKAIEAAGAQLLFLPPYSPDLNPIEMVFAKMRPFYVVRPFVQSTHCGARSAPSPTQLPQQNVPTIFAIAAILSQPENALNWSFTTKVTGTVLSNPAASICPRKVNADQVVSVGTTVSD